MLRKCYPDFHVIPLKYRGYGHEKSLVEKYGNWSKGASLAVHAPQPGVPDRIEIMKLFMRHGFRLDTELIDTRLMPMRGAGSRPDHFEHPRLSPKYGAWNRSFAGSALFWIVIVSACEGASPEDYELIEFLVANGSDTTIGLQGA